MWNEENNKFGRADLEHLHAISNNGIYRIVSAYQREPIKRKSIAVNKETLKRVLRRDKQHSV